MSPGERRLTPSRATLGALGLLAAAAVWSGWPTGGVDAAPELEFTAAPELERGWNEPDLALTRDIRRIVNAAIGNAAERGANPARCRVSVLVQELGKDGPLAELNADQKLRPASNMKVATTAVALLLLGADAQFETVFESSLPPKGGVLQGDLVVRAGADPLIEDGVNDECGERLAEWVGGLKSAGVEAVAGDLVLDLGVYADPAPGPSWPSADQHWTDYCALASGFTANGGCISIEVQSTEAGRPARTSFRPLGHRARVEDDVDTLAARSKLDLHAVVSSRRIRIWGKIPSDVSSWRQGYAHPDPVELFGAVLQSALEDGGVRLEGALRRQRGAPGGHVLATLRSPVRASLNAINTHSNNGVADQLFFKVGAEIAGKGDREGGGRAAAFALARLGIDSDGFRQVDGSGLSRDNRISPRQLVQLLDTIISRGDEVSEAFVESMAVGGKTGTLANRLLDLPPECVVRAKSGWIDGTSALSGMATSAGGRSLLFSVLVDYPRASGINRTVWKPMQDSICKALVRSA